MNFRPAGIPFRERGGLAPTIRTGIAARWSRLFMKLKTLLEVASLALGALATFGQSPGFEDVQPSPSPITLQTGIATVSGGATSNAIASAVLDCRLFQNLTLQVSFSMAGATTSNAVWTFNQSIDRTNWTTAPFLTWTIPANGTNIQTATTNLVVGGAGFIRLFNIQNFDPSLTMTNRQLVYSAKRGAF